MKRSEWIVAAVLALLTLLTLSMASPAPEQVSARGSATDEIATWMHVVLLGSPTATSTAALVRRPPLTPAAYVTIPSVHGSGVVASSTPTQTALPSPTRTPTPTRFPFDPRADLPRYLYVDQETQQLLVFEQGHLVRDIPCSTGLPDSDKYTPAWTGEVGEHWGTFYAFDVYADEAWYLYKSAGSILVHSLPYIYHNGYKVYLEREALGVRPASHGCVRIAPEDAQWLTDWNPQGVLMTITDPYRDKWFAALGTPTPLP